MNKNVFVMEAQYSVEREYGTTSTKCVWYV